MITTLALGALACDKPVEERPLRIEAAKLRELMYAGKFDELERIEKETRDLTRVLPDGQPQRAGFGSIGVMERDICATPSNDPPTLAGYRVLRPNLDAWMKAKPQSRLAPIIDADYYLSLAWAIRGTKFASEVDASAWKGFKENVEIARQKLDRIMGPARTDAVWYQTRMGVALAQGMDEDKFHTLWVEALRAHPEYLPIYFVGTAYFAPRWYGSKEELAAAMKEAESLSPFPDKDVLYARLWWVNGGQDMFWRDGADWVRMKKGMEAMLAAHPAPWNLNALGKFACRAQDRATVRKVLHKIGDKPLAMAWDGRSSYDFCVMIAKQPPPVPPGVMHGKFTGKDFMDKTSHAGEYYYGKPAGTWTWTDESGKVVKTEEHTPLAELKAQREKEELESDAK